MFKSTGSAPAAQDRQAYIPPHIEGAMTDHVQQSMPAHLQKYRGGNAYIPQHAQAEMTQHLENSLPPHMKQYAGAYVQQNVVEPSLARRGAAPVPAQPQPAASSAVPHASVVSPSIPDTPSPVTGTGQPGSTIQPASTAASQPQTSYAAEPGQSPDQSYAFITQPAQLPKQTLSSRLPGGNSLAVRIGLAAGGLLVLFILFSVIRGIVAPGPNLDSFMTIAQEQQELIHLVANASQQQGLPPNDVNLTATMQASLGTTQAQTLQYLTTNHQKINEKQLNLKVSAATDTQLTEAATAGTYNQTYREVLQSQLTAYTNTLSKAYKEQHGPKGQALLKSSYDQAQLFLTQLAEPAS